MRLPYRPGVRLFEPLQTQTLTAQKVRTLRDWGQVYPGEDCGSCGSDIGPSTSYPWHWADEDCRSVRPPIASLPALAVWWVRG